MDEQKSIELLLEHGIKPTSNRIVIIKALWVAEGPVSMKELEYSILSIDKSNIFRTLMLFHAHHLVHAIEDGDGGTKYELCHSHNEEEDEDEHVHFFCECCHKTYCLHEIPIPAISLPLGYEQHGINFLVKGICPHCKNKH